MPHFVYRLVDIILRVIMRIMWFAGGFHWITVKGQRALPAEAPILTLAPHSSYFDAMPVTMTMSSIVMKAESKDIPVWGSKSNPHTNPMLMFIVPIKNSSYYVRQNIDPTHNYVKTAYIIFLVCDTANGRHCFSFVCTSNKRIWIACIISDHTFLIR